MYYSKSWFFFFNQNYFRALINQGTDKQLRLDNTYLILQ